MAGPTDFQVLHLTAELWPFARTGGLGQAVADMAAYQARHGLRTSTLMPLYRAAREVAGGALEPVGEPFPVQVGPDVEMVRCWRLPSKPGTVEALFLDHPPSFDRAGIYGEVGGDYPDNARRFGIFCLGALEVVTRMTGPRVVLHTHDWHTALTSVYLHVTHAQRPVLDRLPVVLSVHNGGYQGHFAEADLPALGLPAWLYSPDWMEWYGRLNYLKGGLRYADVVTTVSHGHADELRSAVGGFGLHDVFQGLGDRLVGVRNGIDATLWDPQTDPEITARFGADDLSGKSRCKAALQRAWGLPQRARVPVFAMSARMVYQKGLDLILASEAIHRLEAQFIFLGAGEPRYEMVLTTMAHETPQRIAVNTQFTDRLEHRLLAGADFLMMPSLYEPCGLTQMRAQRYGALPVARRVGGLAETITDGVTGFLFDDFSAADMDRTLERAAAVYGDQPVYLEHVRAAMRRDFSWAGPAAQYLDAYRRALALH
jgi:starch synthase